MEIPPCSHPPCRATAAFLATLAALGLVSLTSLLAGCGDDPEEPTSLRFGRDAGECIGYCRRSLAVSGARVDLVATSQCPGRPASTLGLAVDLDAPTLAALQATVRDAKGFIRASAPVLGCPDCADGGASWLELPAEGGRDERVTYESHHAPPELVQLDKLLDTIIARFVIPDAASACGLRP